MGKILTSLTVINRADQIRADHNTISSNEIRSVTLNHVVVDKATTTLCLPANVINQLGLSQLNQVDVSTAIGITKARMFQDATIVLHGREGTFACLELPIGRDPVIGLIPLQALGLEPDFASQTLNILPTESADTYFTI
jgi:predicted aspartyl protease